ncbi:hypothetical protein M0R45_008741 [Rubus argutus]|uniref:Disease resistance R13L4/SHOC-2-like LRR domain-containing protein n=1 Tax=Rubus argutus TaxID=59490 RepID=A0AAW1Y261_RUBAR
MGCEVCKLAFLLTNIVNLNFDGLKRCQYLPRLDHLPCLKLVEFRRLQNLEYISNKDWGINSPSDASSSTSTSAVPFFPSLEKLILEDCPNLKGWWRENVATQGIGSSSRRDQKHWWASFPCLSTLEITACPYLASMPPYPYLDKKLILKSTSLKPFQETMMMMKNEDNVSSSFSPLSKLKSLEIGTFDKDIEGVSEGIGELISLELLSIGHSPNLATLPDIGNLKSLQTFEIESLHNLTSLPEGIGKLTSLQRLTIRECHNLTSLPRGIGNLKSIQTLEIESLHNLTSLPEGIGNLTSLHRLTVKCNKLISLPQGIVKLTSLQRLTICHCDNLTSLPEGIGNLESLHFFRIANCNKFTSLPEWIGNLKSLETFEIVSLHKLASLPQGIGNLTSLRQLTVYFCENLISLPQGMHRLTSLNRLELSYCSTLLRKRCKKQTGEDWPKIAHIPNLEIWPIEKHSEPGAY